MTRPSRSGTCSSYAFGEGLVARLRGDEVAARAAFTTARVQQEEAVRMQPEHAPTLCVSDSSMPLSEEKRMRCAKVAGRLSLPIERDSLTGADMIVVFAIICYVRARAISPSKQLAIAIQNPGLVSYGQLKSHPSWDPAARRSAVRENRRLARAEIIAGAKNAPLQLSLQRGAKFREGMGNGLRLRGTEDEDR